MAADTRTGPLVKKLVEGIQEDVAEACDHLSRGHEIVKRLEGECRGVNGLSALLRSKSQELEKMISDLNEEATAVEKKMIGPSMKDEIKTSVIPSSADGASQD